MIDGKTIHILECLLSEIMVENIVMAKNGGYTTKRIARERTAQVRHVQKAMSLDLGVYNE